MVSTTSQPTWTLEQAENAISALRGQLDALTEYAEIATLAGQAVAVQPGTSTEPATQETWHTLSLTSGWSAGTDLAGTSYPPAYKLLPDGNVALRGDLGTPSSGSVTTTTFATIPAAYRPTTNVPTATVVNHTGSQSGAVCLRVNGNLQLSGAFGNSTSIRLDCILNVNGT